MRRLLLLRHAKSDWPAGVTDSDRPLNERGTGDAPRMGAFMAAAKLLPGLTLISPARRTRDTWQLIASKLPQPGEFRVDPGLYAASADAILNIIRSAAPEIETLLIIGHNPGLETLARSFAASGNPEAIRRITKKYPTAGLSVIELPANGWKRIAPPAGRLEMFVTPKSLEE